MALDFNDDLQDFDGFAISVPKARLLAEVKRDIDKLISNNERVVIENFITEYRNIGINDNFEIVTYPNEGLSKRLSPFKQLTVFPELINEYGLLKYNFMTDENTIIHVHSNKDISSLKGFPKRMNILSIISNDKIKEINNEMIVLDGCRIKNNPKLITNSGILLNYNANLAISDCESFKSLELNSFVSESGYKRINEILLVNLENVTVTSCDIKEIKKMRINKIHLRDISKLLASVEKIHNLDFCDDSYKDFSISNGKYTIKNISFSDEREFKELIMKSETLKIGTEVYSKNEKFEFMDKLDFKSMRFSAYKK